MRGVMSRQHSLIIALTLVAVLVPGSVCRSQMDSSRAVAGGGIRVRGWKGGIDANEARRGGKLENSKLEKKGKVLHVTTGPATNYWNPANKASGDYTVKATFTEPKYMNLMG